MIQRIQSVYLLLASVLSVVGLCLPVAYIVVGRGDMTLEASVMERVYNLWVSNASESGYSLTTWPLFVLLLAAAALTLYTIFAFRNRVVQARLCLFISFLLLGWHLVFAVFSQVLVDALAGESFQPAFGAFLPFVALLLTVLARRAIIADEKMVRAADRIR